MADILHLIKIKAPRDKVYQALATAEGVRNWWTRDADVDSKVGGTGEFRFYGGERITKVRIEKLEPPALVVWRALSAPIPTWANSSVEFELRAADQENTSLHFTQRGIQQADDMFAMSTSAWGYFLVSLKEYLETGKGMPHPDDVFSRAAEPKNDFRLPTAAKWQAPRAVADGASGMIIAVAEVSAPPESVFRAFATDEVVRWWRAKGYYHWENWQAELRVCGAWSVTVLFEDGSINGGSGEFVEIEPPRKLVMTRRFEKHPLQGAREDTITYRFEPVTHGTRVTVRDEGYAGRSEAAYGNAEHWERVLGWLAAYFESTATAAA